MKTGKRLPNGLIEGLEYIKDEITGKINWFKMIPKEHLYFNIEKTASIEKRIGKPIKLIDTSEGLESEVVIKLSGIQWLLNTRGFNYVKTTIDSCNSEFAAATCEISFIPNEECPDTQIWSSSASAHAFNTKSWYKQYLTEASSNRALCRAVRFYLLVSSVSAEELGANTSNDDIDNNIKNDDIPTKKLQEVMDKNHITLDMLKLKMTKDNITGADKYKSLLDIPNEIKFNYINKINKKFA